MASTSFRYGAFVAISLVPLLASAATRINPGTARWAAAAREGRADMFLMGDSIVEYGVGGWSVGIALAAQQGIGLAGSSLMEPYFDAPYAWVDYTGARIFSDPPSDSVQSGVASLTPSGRHHQVGLNFSFVGTGNDPVKMDLYRPIDWHVFANGTAPDAQLQGIRYGRTTEPWSMTALEVAPVQAVAQQVNQLSDYVFRFGATDDPRQWNGFEFTNVSRNTSLYYTKLIHPDMTGMAVSGWSYSGGTTQGFRDNYYNHSRFTPEGRNALYHSLIAGNSGKLNVPITFAVNDANTKTPAAFGEDIEGLIADVRRDWQAAGLPMDDLSFTLVSAYQVDANRYSASAFIRLDQYRAVLDAISASDPQISFIDMWEAGPTWQQAVANGYLDDNVHPSPLGTRLYGRTLLEQFLPTQGDADIDGDVDFDDLLALAQHYGEANGAWREGDFDGLGGVTFDDLLVLAQHYGTGASIAADQFASDWALAQSMVPEPTLLASFASVSIMMRRRRV